jgi:hypothetical protein
MGVWRNANFWSKLKNCTIPHDGDDTYSHMTKTGKEWVLENVEGLTLDGVFTLYCISTHLTTHEMSVHTLSLLSNTSYYYRMLTQQCTRTTNKVLEDHDCCLFQKTVI